MKTRINNHLYSFYNLHLQNEAVEIVQYFKDNPKMYGKNKFMPSKGEYDNGIDNETGEALTGYAIDFNELDKSFLYSSKNDCDDDFKKLNQVLDLIIN